MSYQAFLENEERIARVELERSERELAVAMTEYVEAGGSLESFSRRHPYFARLTTSPSRASAGAST